MRIFVLGTYMLESFELGNFIFVTFEKVAKSDKCFLRQIK